MCITICTITKFFFNYNTKCKAVFMSIIYSAVTCSANNINSQSFRWFAVKALFNNFVFYFDNKCWIIAFRNYIHMSAIGQALKCIVINNAWIISIGDHINPVVFVQCYRTIFEIRNYVIACLGVNSVCRSSKAVRKTEINPVFIVQKNFDIQIFRLFITIICI